MYLDFKVDIPVVVKGKITYREKAGTKYVYYEYDRIYDKDTQKTNPKRITTLSPAIPAHFLKPYRA